MTNNRYIFVLAIILLIAFSPGHTQQLWNGTEVGQAVSDVKGVFPGVTFYKDIDNGEEVPYTRMWLEEYEIIGHSFGVHFDFRDDSLFRVMLATSTSDSEKASKLIGDLVDLLLQKYGPEKDAAVDAGDVGGNIEVRWVSGDTDIELFAAYTLVDNLIFIQYSSETKAALDSL